MNIFDPRTYGKPETVEESVLRAMRGERRPFTTEELFKLIAEYAEKMPAALRMTQFVYDHARLPSWKSGANDTALDGLCEYWAAKSTTGVGESPQPPDS